MCENLHYESVYFKELHNEQEYCNLQYTEQGQLKFRLLLLKHGVYTLSIYSSYIHLPSTETTQAVANKLQTGPVETFQKTQISEIELISKGEHLLVAEYKCLAIEKKTYFSTTKTLRK